MNLEMQIISNPKCTQSIDVKNDYLIGSLYLLVIKHLYRSIDVKLKFLGTKIVLDRILQSFLVVIFTPSLY